MSVVGFDFGNNTCKIAIARKGSIEVIMNDCSSRQTPSVVGYTDTNRQVGEAGLAQSIGNFKNTAYDLKRILGRTWGDAEFEKDVSDLAYKVIRGDADQVLLQVNYNGEALQLSPEQVTGALFTHLKQLAENALEGQKVVDCVIGVPPFCTDKMRRAFMDAANVAGLNVLRLMNENSAIALQYGLLRSLPEKNPIKVLFFDMGHSQTTVSLCSFIQGNLTMLASASHRTLGGRDFDRVITQSICEYAQQKYKLDIMSNTKALLRVNKQCEKIKKMLSANLESPYNIECIMNDTDVKGTLNREQYEALCVPLVEQIMLPLKEVVSVSGLELKDIDAFEVLGGASRVPCVRKTLTEFFGRPLSTTCNADESVARGCALQCAMLSPSFRVREFVVNDVTAAPVSLSWGNLNAPADESVALFTRFNAIPSVKQISFSKADAFEITAHYTNASDLPAGLNPVIAKFTVTGVPQGVSTKQKLKVKLDVNGLLSVVSAQALEEDKDGKSDTMEVDGAAAPAEDAADEEKSDSKKKKKYKKTELSYSAVFAGGFSAAEITKGVELEASQAGQDRVVAETAEKRNDLESFIYEIRNDISADLAPYVESAVADRFNTQLNEAEDWLSSDEGYSAQKSEYVRKLSDLKSVSDPIKFRKNDSQNRSASVSSFRSSLTKYRLQASSPDAKFAHIDAAEKAKVLNLVAEGEAWLEQTQLRQDSLPLTADPVLTCSECDNRRGILERLAHPILSKPIPPPAPVPAATPSPTATPTPSTESSSSEASSETPAASSAEEASAKPSSGMDLD